MKLIAFSDWRVQSIEKLIEYIQSLEERPDFLIYSGDDISRFNSPSMSLNYFEELAKLSKQGLIAIAGNDEKPIVTRYIKGKKVYNLHKKELVSGDFVFVGVEGAPTPPGFIVHSEKVIQEKIYSCLKKFQNKKLIIVSHAPPKGILDIGLRFGINHIGSSSLRKIIDSHGERIKLVICGHVHSQGGKIENHNGVFVINCASHDTPGDPGKVCTINTDKIDESRWDLIYEWGVMKKEIFDLMRIPLIGESRAKILVDYGIRSVETFASLNPAHQISQNVSFKGGVLHLTQNYAKAIVTKQPIIFGPHPFFKEPGNIYFFDTEYDPTGTKNGPFGIFLIGIMNTSGKSRQLFCNDYNNEKRILLKFRNWLIEEKPVLVSYSSSSADKPQLINAFNRFNIPIDELRHSFFDLYYDCINTQKHKKQVIFLPVESSMGVKGLSETLGYKAPKNMKIQDGLQALGAYKEYLITKKKKTKAELLKYNHVDLERTKFVFDYISKTFEANR